MFIDYIRRVGAFRGSVALGALGIIAFNLIRGQLDIANQTSSVIAAVFGVLSLVGVGGPGPTLALPTDIRKIAEEVRQVWKEQERKRGLSDSSFIPLRVQIDPTGESNNPDAAQFLQEPAKSPVWNLQDMRRSCAAAVYRFQIRRTVIFGGEGAGKSTIAVALTLGLIERYFDRDGNLVPITLSLSSWDSKREKFDDWLNRRVETLYPILRSFKRPKDGIARALTDAETFVFILDGLDEFADGGRFEDALKEISDFFPESQHLCILSRDHLRTKVSMPRMATLRLGRSRPSAVREYLDSLSRESDTGGVQELHDSFTSEHGQQNSALIEVLCTPLYLRSAYHAIIEENLTATEVVSAARTGGQTNLKEKLLAAEIDRALNQAPILQQKRAMHWLKYMAYDMEARDYQSFAWWRVGDAIPRTALAGMATVLIAPAYLLATIMPVGLTRGLAVGVSAGALMGILRGYEVTLRQSLVPTIISWLAVYVIASQTYIIGQALADSTEIALATFFVLNLKERLLVKNPVYAGLLTALMSGIVAGCVFVVGLFADFTDANRGPRDIAVAVFLGVGIATLSGRLLIEHPRDRMQASRIRLTLSKRIVSPVRPLISAVLAASLIGFGGGLTGVIRFGQEYGSSLILFFGLTIGVPVGIFGGIVKWLSLPLAAGIAAQGLSPATVDGAPLRSDRIVAIATITGLSIAATGAIFLFLGFLGDSLRVIKQFNPIGFELNPVQGILYGVTMGIVVACFFTAWPTYFIAHLWLVCVGRRYPWQHQTFLDALVNVNLVRNEGPLLQFRHRELQTFLARSPI